MTNPADTVVIVGQGYVGLPLARAMCRAGLTVVGLDANESTVDGLNSGRSHVDDVRDDELAEMRAAGYRATTDAAVIADARTAVIAVPTPLGQHREPDLSAVESASRSIAENLRPGTLVVLESTTYPGTTEEIVKPILETSGLSLDDHFWLAFSPERIDPGNDQYGLENTPKIVGGVTPASTDAAAAFYSRFVTSVVRTRGAREAETAKLLENTYRHINIALVNEMARFCAELGIDIWDVIRAASTKPFGFEAFYPGPGVGGHCIPIDPNYLSFDVKRRLGYPFRFVELAQEINESMPSYVVDRLQAALNERGLALKGMRVLLLGVTYKSNISDQRESPARPVGEILLERGAVLSYHDPRVEHWIVADQEIERALDLDGAIADAGAVILLQAHDEYEVDDLAARSRLFFDTRGRTTGDTAIRL
ncbi:MAG: nucleotide sugar dehydrogenase [Pseudolysinimonas sp.]